MAGWSIPNRARADRAADRAAMLARVTPAARCLKEAAYMAGVSERTARRYRAETR